MKKVTAIFIGSNNSCGYQQSKEYQLEVHHDIKSARIFIKSPNYVEYESFFAFINNWKNISEITK